MVGGAETGSAMVKSCLINAFLYTVLTDGPGSLLRRVWIEVTYRKSEYFRLETVFCFGIR